MILNQTIVRFQLLTIFIFLFVHASYGGDDVQRTKADVVKQVFGNEQIFNVVVNAEQVTAQRLHFRSHEQGGSLSSYDRDELVVLSPTIAKDIQRLIQKPSSYDWMTINKCSVDYGILLAFHSGQRTVRIALCLHCREISVFDGLSDNAERVNQEHQFDPMRKQLIAIAKFIFPNDPEIQSQQ